MQHKIISWEAINLQRGRWFVDQRADQCVPKPHTAIEQVVRDVIRLQPVDRATFNVDIDLTIVILIMCGSVVTVKLFCTFLMLLGLTV